MIILHDNKSKVTKKFIDMFKIPLRKIFISYNVFCMTSKMIKNILRSGLSTVDLGMLYNNKNMGS